MMNHFGSRFLNDDGTWRDLMKQEFYIRYGLFIGTAKTNGTCTSIKFIEKTKLYLTKPFQIMVQEAV